MKITTSIKISLVAILAGLIIAANANPNPNLKDSQRFRFSKFAFIILTFHFQKLLVRNNSKSNYLIYDNIFNRKER